LKTNGKLEPTLGVIIAAFFAFGCVATAHRSPRALPPRAVSFGLGLNNLNDIEKEDDGVQLLNTDLRVGLGKGIDFGVMHLLDITEDNDGAFSGVWGDARFQLTNLSNAPGKPILSFGVSPGYLYDEDVELWGIAYPISFGIPSRSSTFYLTWRPEYFSDDFRIVPKSESQPRNLFLLGWEFGSYNPARSLSPKLVAELGVMNSLVCGRGDNQFLWNICLNFDIQPAR